MVRNGRNHLSFSRQHGLDYRLGTADRDFIGREALEVQREHGTENWLVW